MKPDFLFEARRYDCVCARSAVLACLLLVPLQGVAQGPSPSSPTYSLRVTVNEVALTFHASDAQHVPVLDLKPDELDVFDNERGPGQIVSLQQLRDRSIHAALILDTSGSVASQTSRSRAKAQEAVRKLLVRGTDEGAAIAFGRSRSVVQGWTAQKGMLLNGIAEIGVGSQDPIDGTSLYDTLYSTCLYEFGKSIRPRAARAILLFSDGVDTTSHTTLQAAIESCRESQTAIYSFRPDSVAGTSSLGLSTLLRLARETGGRSFHSDDPDGKIPADLHTVESDLRNEYFLLYRPKTLPHDGAFHTIVVVGPKRVAEIIGTSGFYAPSR